MADLMDAYFQTPPVARTLATAVFATSIGFYFGFIPFQWLYFHQSLLFQIPPQIWRLVTCYLVTHPKLSILLDPYFLYSYISQLETSNPRFSRREDLAWYLAFVSTAILIFDTALGFNSGFYLQGLILALAYTVTQDQRGIKANFFFITIPAQLVPYSIMLVSLLMVGPGGLMLQLCGLVAAHLYDFLTRIWPEFGGGQNILATPAFVSRLAGVPSGVRAQTQTYGTALRPTRGAVPPSGGGGVLPDSWRTRGRGQRLGGD